MDPALPDADPDEIPLAHRAHHVAGAIYGTILATSIVAAVGSDPKKLAHSFIIVLVTSLVFYLAHVYSQSVGVRITVGHALERADVGRIALSEWPMLQSSWPILLMLALGSLGIVNDKFASTLAMLAGIAALFSYGIIAGRQEGVGWQRQLLNALITTAFGVAILTLKILVH